MKLAAFKQRIGLTVGDQVFSSASNFAVGIVVARASGPRALGVFALCYVVWLFVAGLHRSLITEPMMIERAGEEPARISEGMRAEISLGVVSAAVIAGIGVALKGLGQTDLGSGLLWLAPWMPVLLVQDFWRWVGFMQRRPGKALGNDVTFAVVQFAALGIFIVNGRTDIGAALSAWGLGALAGTLLGLRQFDRARAEQSGIASMRASWPQSRWLLGDFATWFLSVQASMFLIAGLLGPLGLGALKAAQNLMGPTNVLLQAGGTFGLPESVERYAERGWSGLHRFGLRLSGTLALGVGAYAVVVAVFGRELMTLAFGGRFSEFGGIAAVVAVHTVVAAAATGPNMGLKTSGNTASLFVVRAITTVVSLGSVLILAPRFGLAGAAWAGVVAATVNTSCMWAFFNARRTDDAVRPERVPQPVLEGDGATI